MWDTIWTDSTLIECLIYSTYTLAYLWVFWGFYVLVMGLYRVHLMKKLKGFSAVLAAPFIVVGWCMDLLANVLIAPVVFLELPKELMVTSRLKRYRTYSSGYRYNISSYICENLLDVFDPSGDHC